MSIRVVAVDIGSVGPSANFAWVALDALDRQVDNGPPNPQRSENQNPESAAEALLIGLSRGDRAALVLEAPMSVPVPDSWSRLGKARANEGSRPWSAGAGCGALATGLAQGAWMLGRVAEAMPELGVTTQRACWELPGAPLLLAEAFVSADSKPAAGADNQNLADALAAGSAFLERPMSSAPDKHGIRCEPDAPFNLLAAMALWAGLRIDPGELREEVLVISALRAQPAVAL